MRNLQQILLSKKQTNPSKTIPNNIPHSLFSKNLSYQYIHQIQSNTKKYPISHQLSFNTKIPQTHNFHSQSHQSNIKQFQNQKTLKPIQINLSKDIYLHQNQNLNHNKQRISKGEQQIVIEKSKYSPLIFLSLILIYFVVRFVFYENKQSLIQKDLEIKQYRDIYENKKIVKVDKDEIKDDKLENLYERTSQKFVEQLFIRLKIVEFIQVSELEQQLEKVYSFEIKTILMKKIYNKISIHQTLVIDQNKIKLKNQWWKLQSS